MIGLFGFMFQLLCVLGFILVVMGMWGINMGYEEAGKDFAKVGGFAFLYAFALICLGLLMAYIHKIITGEKG